MRPLRFPRSCSSRASLFHIEKQQVSTHHIHHVTPSSRAVILQINPSRLRPIAPTASIFVRQRSKVPSGHWKVVENLKKALDDAEEKLGIKEVGYFMRSETIIDCLVAIIRLRIGIQ